MACRCTKVLALGLGLDDAQPPFHVDPIIIPALLQLPGQEASMYLAASIRYGNRW